MTMRMKITPLAKTMTPKKTEGVPLKLLFRQKLCLLVE
jgi:hypothetical protein